jgi:ABC-type nitrate/sulfonate/bicarbonate transport system substrate-binding protein
MGFLPVSDCAPLVYAQEAGLFAKYELVVELTRETSWGDLRDKVIHGELDAAHTPASLPFLANLGVDSDPCACVSGLVLSLQGNAITLARPLSEAGVIDAAGLREQIYHSWRKKTFTFAVGHYLSTQHHLLNQWLRSGGIVPEHEVKIVVVPPAQMFPTMKLGYIDGYCVGEPWTSVAVQAGEGVCVATSGELAPLHPEKVLMVRQSFAQGRSEEHQRLIAALLEACDWCDQPGNRVQLGELLAQARYVNAPPECLTTGLPGPAEFGARRDQTLATLGIFSRYAANDPTNAKAEWIIRLLYNLLQQSSLDRRSPGRTPVLKNIFRRDIFERAQALRSSTNSAQVPSGEDRVDLVAGGPA